MALKKAALIFLSLVFAVALMAALFLQDMMNKARAHMKLSSAQCADDPESVSKENPNKMLFVSCGGFLD